MIHVIRRVPTGGDAGTLGVDVGCNRVVVGTVDAGRAVGDAGTLVAGAERTVGRG